MLNNNGVNQFKQPKNLRDIVLRTCLDEGVDDLVASTVAEIVSETVKGHMNEGFRGNINWLRARAFEEPDTSEDMAKFGKAVSKIIVEEIIMNENIIVLK